MNKRHLIVYCIVIKYFLRVFLHIFTLKSVQLLVCFPYLKIDSRLMQSPCCLCVRVSPLPTFGWQYQSL
jgi:hypothetical protein